MPNITPQTRQLIKDYLEGFLLQTVQRSRARKALNFTNSSEYLSQTSTSAQLKPFHAAILPTEILKVSQFERGLSTSLGTTFEECARLIARDHHAEARRSYDVRGSLSLETLSEIETQVSRFEHSSSDKPTLSEMVDTVLATRAGEITQNRATRSDLYIRKHDGTEYYFEMKSPVPNKGQCIEATQRILRTHALRNLRRPAINVYFAMAYNPFGYRRSDYAWGYTLNYTPFDEAVIIGHEFWDIIGGEGTYEEVLDIYNEVGQDKRAYIIDSLANGF
jgi:hypothetical protein